VLHGAVPVSVSHDGKGNHGEDPGCLLKSRGVVYVYSMARGSLGVCQGTDAHTCSTRDEYMVGGHPAPAPRVANGGEQSSEGARGRYYPVMRLLSRHWNGIGLACHAMPHLPSSALLPRSFSRSPHRSPQISLSAGVLTRSSRSKHGASKDRFIIYQAHGTFFF